MRARGTAAAAAAARTAAPVKQHGSVVACGHHSLMQSFQQFLHSRRRGGGGPPQQLARSKSQAASVLQTEWSTTGALPHSVSSREHVGTHEPQAAAHTAQPSLQQLLHTPKQPGAARTEQRSPRTASAALAVAAATAATSAAMQASSSFDDALTNAVAAAGAAAAQHSLSTVRREGPSPLQPLSLADVSRSSASTGRASRGAAPSGSQTPTGSGRRYDMAGGASLSRHVSAEPSAAASGSWPATQQQQTATGLAAGSRRASVADAMAAIQRQQLLLQQLSSSRKQQQQQQPSPPDAGGLLDDLDHRFASIKHSLREVFSTQPHGSPATAPAPAQQPPTPPAAAPLPSLHASAASAGRQQFLGEAAGDPFSLGNSSTSSLEEGTVQAQEQPGQHAQHTGDSDGSQRFSVQRSAPEDVQIMSVAGGVPNASRHDRPAAAAVPGLPLAAAVAASDDVLAALADDYGSLLDAGADVLSSSTAQPASSSAGNHPGAQQQQQQRGGSKPPAVPWRPARAVGSGSSSRPGSGEATPQPRAQRPKPSVLQQRQQLSLKQQGPSSRPGAGHIGGSSSNNTAAAAAASGVLEDEQRWASNALVRAKQQAAELQQQNDALVRVLERERQQHANVRQQCADTQLAFKEAEAEWAVLLHSLRHDKAAAQGQLRRALAGGDSQEVVDAYDAALAGSAARVHEAQTAAAALAQQLTEVELQLSQLKHVCSTSGLLPAVGDAREGGSGRTDGAAVILAVLRSPQKQQQHGPAAATPGDCSSMCGATRGVIALRQHQRHLEQQVLKQAEALAQLEREGIRLLRYKTQFEAAADRLAALAASKASAEAFAQDAGLRAAAAAGRADRLELKVEDLRAELEQVQADRDSLQQQLALANQQQQQAESSSPHHQQQPGWSLHAASANTRDAASSPIHASTQQCTGKQQPREGVAAMLRQPPASTAVSTAGIMAARSPAQQPAITNQQLDVQPQHQRPAPPAPSSSDQRALRAVAQLSAALQPSEAVSSSPVHAQLAALLAAIKTGVEERQALSKQGDVLLDLLMQPAARR